jgi:4-hydroxybenzoyl-CoA thioesterase
MARVKLELPRTFGFATEIEVRITDVNYGRHMGNDAALSLIHEARVRFLRHHGMHEGDVGGAALILSDAAIVYRAEAFAGDVLRFEVAVGDLGRAGCDFFYRATRVADGKVIVEAKTGAVFLDPTTRRIVALPETLKRLVPGPSPRP